MEMQATCLHVGVERQQEQERRDSRKNDGTSKEELKLKEELAGRPFVGNRSYWAFKRAVVHTFNTKP